MDLEISKFKASLVAFGAGPLLERVEEEKELEQRKQEEKESERRRKQPNGEATVSHHLKLGISIRNVVNTNGSFH